MFTYVRNASADQRSEQRRLARILADHVNGTIEEDIVLAQMGTGSGKSITAASLYYNLDVHFGFFGPEYWVVDQTFRKLGIYDIPLIRGYAHYQPEKGLNYSCLNSTARQLSKLGWNAAKVCEGCSYRGTCEKHVLRAALQISPVKRFGSSHAMAHGMLNVLKKARGRKVAVFDENPLISYEQDIIIEQKDLRISRDQINSLSPEVVDNDTGSCILYLIEEMRRLQAYGKHVIDYDSMKDKIDDFNPVTAQSVSEAAVEKGTELAEAMVGQAHASFYPRNVVIPLIDWLTFVKRRDLDPDQIAELVKRLYRHGQPAQISLGATRAEIIPRMVDAGIKVVILDATGNSDILSVATGKSVKYVSSLLQRRVAEHHRIKTWAYPKATFAENFYRVGTDPSIYARGADNLLGKIFDTLAEITRAYEGKKVFLIVYRTVSGIDMVEFFKIGLAMRNLKNGRDYDIHYYGSGRGTDQFGDARVVVLIGRYNIPPNVYRRKSIFWNVSEDIVKELCVKDEFRQQMGRAGRDTDEPIIVVNIGSVDVDLGVEPTIHTQIKKMKAHFHNRWAALPRRGQAPGKRKRKPVSRRRLRPFFLRTAVFGVEENLPFVE
jgi:hypothetical protein